MKKVVIFGNGKFAEVVYFYLTNDSSYKVEAFTVNKRFIKEKKLFGLPVIPFEEIESSHPPKKVSMFVAIGYTNLNKLRAKIFNDVKKKGYSLISYINSKAVTWDKVNIGENCFILESNVIQPFVTIEDNVIMWSGNHIGHHSVIGKHCFITSHVVVSGGVNVGSYSFLGVNSTIRDYIKIGKECIIGAGSVILKNTKQKEVYTTKSTKILPITSNKIKDI
jgi:sugar O-acyltransferase (sialic acid O-acetyltransferase NeuD family)